MKIIISRLVALSATLTTLLLAPVIVAGTLDPVSSDEINRAMLLAAPKSALQARGLTADGDADTSANTEFLGVKAHRFEKSEQNKGFRWADALVYDYSTDELITTVIDLDSNETISVRKSKEMQPPISANELERAIGIVFEDDEEFAILNTEFREITGETLSRKDQVNYKAFTFFADSMPDVVNVASENCGIQRCAQIMLYTNEQVAFGSSPIVNLSAGLVSQRIGF